MQGCKCSAEQDFAYTGQQLIPGLLFEVLEFGVIDLGSVSEGIDHLVKAYLLALYTGQFRMILKIILKKKVLSFKLQASSSRIPKGSGFFKTKKDLTMIEGFSRMRN